MQSIVVDDKSGSSALVGFLGRFEREARFVATEHDLLDAAVQSRLSIPDLLHVGIDAVEERRFFAFGLDRERLCLWGIIDVELGWRHAQHVPIPRRAQPAGVFDMDERVVERVSNRGGGIFGGHGRPPAAALRGFDRRRSSRPRLLG
jgi:hypothetical protein